MENTHLNNCAHNRYVKAPKFSAHCHNHFYPEEAGADATYEQLDLLTLSGAFAFWLIMFATAIVRT